MMHINEAWEKYKADGSGIRVALLDTGIDYMHPAFGGGFGAGHRVYDGYDFFNEDNDPMDDNGHGTSVAGIFASGDSLWTGVAPNCQVLGAKSGRRRWPGRWHSPCWRDWSMRVDPDKDPTTDDGAHVANISLGSSFLAPPQILWPVPPITLPTLEWWCVPPRATQAPVRDQSVRQAAPRKPLRLALLRVKQ